MTTIRPAVEADLARLVELNNDAVPAVSPADPARMRELIGLASACWVVESAGVELAGLETAATVVGFVLLFEPGSGYDSPNYRWFTERFERFLYVDRVVVAPEARGGGVGALVYDAVAAEALARSSERVTAEVNLVPPNPGSSRFHRRHGFVPVGTIRFGDDYEVEMLAREVGVAAAT